MDKAQLKKSLNELHEQLSQEDRVDPATVRLLQTLTDDIDRLVEKQAAPSADEKAPVSSGMSDLLLKFEAEHPQLAITLGRIADGLSRMGI